MNESLPPVSYLLTALAAFAGGLGLGITQRVSAGLISITRKAYHLLWAGILRPFRWASTAISEWRRVSAYRHRRIIWDDLPQESKNTVLFEDLGEEARGLINWHHLPQLSKDQVRFQNLSEEARAEIGMSDLPTSEKRILLEDFILPRMQGADQGGSVTLFDDSNRTRLNEHALIEVEPKGDYVDVLHDGMNLSLKVTFEQPEEGIPFPTGGTISCSTSDWAIVGTIQYRDRISPGRQSIMVWVTSLSLYPKYANRLNIFSDAG